MDFDLNQFDAEIARYDQIHAQNGHKGIAMGAAKVSSDIAKAVVSLLPQVHKAMPDAEKEKLAYLCAKAVEYSYYTSRRILQAQFYCYIEEYKAAVDIFKDVVEVCQHPVECPKWPHLQKTSENMILVEWMAAALAKSGQTEESQKFSQVLQGWKKSEPPVPPEPR